MEEVNPTKIYSGDQPAQALTGGNQQVNWQESKQWEWK